MLQCQQKPSKGPSQIEWSHKGRVCDIVKVLNVCDVVRMFSVFRCRELCLSPRMRCNEVVKNFFVCLPLYRFGTPNNGSEFFARIHRFPSAIYKSDAIVSVSDAPMHTWQHYTWSLKCYAISMNSCKLFRTFAASPSTCRTLGVNILGPILHRLHRSWKGRGKLLQTSILPV